MINKNIISVLILGIILGISSCASTQIDTPDFDQSYFPSSNMCAAVFGFQISPDGEFESFEINTKHECGDGITTVEVSDAWYKTACAYFSTEISTYKIAPTYKKGEEPKQMWAFYYINPERLDAVYPKLTSGTSDDDRFVYVQDSIMDNDTSDHACSNITKRTKK